MKKRLLLIIVTWTITLILSVTACSFPSSGNKSQNLEMPIPQTLKKDNTISFEEKLISKYKSQLPKEWGEKVEGVNTMLATTNNVIALTFDACGTSAKSKGYDSKLIDYLISENIPATLFLSGIWIDENPEIFKSLANNPLFEIGNHGLKHLPCSVNGKSAYKIAGTANISEVIEEVDGNGKKVEALTGKKPVFYRSGTDYYDEIAVSIVKALGYQTISYSVLGDAGATFKTEQVKNALLSSVPGSIVICHMNHPESDTAEGIIEAIPLLKEKGFKFARLSDFELN